MRTPASSIFAPLAPSCSYKSFPILPQAFTREVKVLKDWLESSLLLALYRFHQLCLELTLPFLELLRVKIKFNQGGHKRRRNLPLQEFPDIHTSEPCVLQDRLCATHVSQPLQGIFVQQLSDKVPRLWASYVRRKLQVLAQDALEDLVGVPRIKRRQPSQ